MVRKSRIRGGAITPKYITGLGDGHVENNNINDVLQRTNLKKKAQQLQSPSTTDDEILLQKAVQKRRNNRLPHHVVAAGQQHHQQQEPQDALSYGADGIPAGIDPLVVIFPDQHNNNHAIGTGSTSEKHVGFDQNSNNNININKMRYYHNHQTTSSPVYDPWEAQAMYLVAAAVFVLITAVFLHLVSENNNHQKSSNHHHHSSESRIKSPHNTIYHNNNNTIGNKTHHRNAKVRTKKKTDEWNEDSKEEEDLLSESVRGGGGAGIMLAGGEPHLVDETGSTPVGSGGSVVDGSSPTALLYYPYQPRLQQHRHRKNSSSSATSVVVGGAATTTSHLHPELSPQPQHHVTTTTTASSRSYYLNQSGSAVIAGYSSSHNNNNTSISTTPSRSPMIHRSSSLHAAAGNNNYCPPSPLPTSSSVHSRDTPVHQHAHPAMHQPTSIFQTASSDSQARPSIVARPLSTTASSFESLTDDISVATPMVEQQCSFAETSPHRSQRSAKGRITDATLDVKTPFQPSYSREANEDLTPLSGQHRPMRVDLVDKTPRAANGRNVLYPINMPVPEDHPLNEDSYSQTPQQQRKQMGSTDPQSSAASNSTDLDLLFATSPSLRRQQKQQASERLIPFVPSLAVHVSDARPPKSMNIDQLHLFQLMESGNVSHWEERVAAESRQLESRVFPVEDTNNNNIRDSVLAASASDLSGSFLIDSIPSDDPRKGINHKRNDLTDATDASSSLQGAIDFSELKLVDVIGGGGFGQVWKAYWRGTPVAVKVLTGSAQSKSVPRPVLEEFAAEINLLKGMRHPNICLYMGACLEPPNRAIITELAANGSLWDALRLPLCPPYVPCDGTTRQGWPDSLYQPDTRHGAPPTASSSKPSSLSSIPPKGSWHWTLVKRVACGAARGLSYLHGGKVPVLHRDLKSANILLDDSYTAKVCDFGLSRLKAQERSMTGNCGTVQWMAPEVLANQSYNEKADVYSYGVILWELLTRQCPYDKMTPIQCALAVLNRNQRPEIPKWCPPSFQALIRACWKKDPDERPTFAQILAALDAMPP